MIRPGVMNLVSSRVGGVLHELLFRRGNPKRDAAVCHRTPQLRIAALSIVGTLLIAGVLSWNRCALAQYGPQQPQHEINQNLLLHAQAAEAPREKMSLELNRLASICKRLELEEEEEICRGWLQNSRLDQQRFYLPAELPVIGSRPESAQWREHFIQARKEYAASLFEEAGMAAESGDETRAFRLLWQVLREDPNHAVTQRILGPLAGSILSKPQRRSPRNPLELTGLGPISRWQSRHFDVISRATVSDTLELITQLERIYSLFTQVFYGFWAPTGLLNARLGNENSPWPDRQRLQVVLFADRDEYLKILGVAESNIGVSVGYYNSVKQTSFFYNVENNFETVIHELTHQFLAESCRFFERSSDQSTSTTRDRGRSPVPLDQVSGAWGIEGIALYMESLNQAKEGWTLGGAESPRLQAARYRAVRDQYWPNWADFTKDSIAQWKEKKDIPILYSHAAGLTHALLDMYPDKAKAGQILERYLASIYLGEPEIDEIWALLGGNDETASTKYREMLTVNDTQMQDLASGDPSSIKELVLSRSQLSSWQLLSAFLNLEWLDLSYSNFDSTSVVVLAELHQLRRLSLEGITLTAQAVKEISRLTSIEELDLSECEVDDEMFRFLTGHPSLQVLWLSHNNVTDLSLETLGTLPNLRRCEISQTGITAQAWKDFLASHPVLNSDTP